MAVTIVAADLADAAGADYVEDAADVDRVFAACVEVVERWAEDAPDAVQNEAVVRMGAHLLTVRGGVRSERADALAQGYASAEGANALKYSGAAALLSHWRNHGFGPSE